MGWGCHYKQGVWVRFCKDLEEVRKGACHEATWEKNVPDRVASVEACKVGICAWSVYRAARRPWATAEYPKVGGN